jgi:hypothetical protein
LFGAEHYVKARDRGYVLYVEGSTDVDMLRALAQRLKHPVADEWDDRLNSYYVQNTYPEQTLESELDRVGMGYGCKPREHFNWLRTLLPSLRGLAILDNDGQNRLDSDEGGLRVVYWRRYEAENYFISPEVLRSFSNNHYGEGSLFAHVIDEVLDAIVLEQIFGGNAGDFRVWNEGAPEFKRVLWERTTDRMKLSTFAEEFFRRLGAELSQPMILRKGELHRLIDFVAPESIPAEVSEKLNLLLGVLTG